MHWDASENGGFTTGRPWLPLDPGYGTCHVEGLSRDPTSILTLYRRLIELRRRHLALSVGSYTPVTVADGVLAYERRHGAERLLVLLNLGHEPSQVPCPASGAVLLSTALDRDREEIRGEVALRPDEGLILVLHSATSS
jgi:alpha-glucosidase